MAWSCGQLCRNCKSLLSSKAGTRTWQFYTQIRHNVTSTMAPRKTCTEIFVKGNLTTGQSRLRWSSQILYYKDSSARYFSTEAKNEKIIDDRNDAVPYKPSLLPKNEVAPQSDSQYLLDLDDATELSALEEISDEEAASISVPTIPSASLSLQDYVDSSETLTKLVQLGVNLWKLEQRPNVGSMLLRLDFNTDITPRLLFLKEIGVEDSRFGYIITHNPFILTESVDNLQARVNYLKSKRFSTETVASMVSRAPYLLNFSVKRLDNRLGFYQEQLSLSASNTQNIVARLPRLLCGSLEPVKENLKVCEFEFGFKKNEIQQIVIAVPKVLSANKMKLTKIFDFIHNTMKVPHHLIAKFPQVLNSKYLRLRERHFFLEYLGKAQYEPSLDNYISLDQLVSLPDEVFCTELALATLEDFYLFQKTL